MIINCIFFKFFFCFHLITQTQVNYHRLICVHANEKLFILLFIHHLLSLYIHPIFIIILLFLRHTLGDQAFLNLILLHQRVYPTLSLELLKYVFQLLDLYPQKLYTKILNQEYPFIFIKYFSRYFSLYNLSKYTRELEY